MCLCAELNDTTACLPCRAKVGGLYRPCARSPCKGSTHLDFVRAHAQVNVPAPPICNFTAMPVQCVYDPLDLCSYIKGVWRAWRFNHSLMATRLKLLKCLLFILLLGGDLSGSPASLEAHLPRVPPQCDQANVLFAPVLFCLLDSRHPYSAVITISAVLASFTDVADLEVSKCKHWWKAQLKSMVCTSEVSRSLDEQTVCIRSEPEVSHQLHAYN